MCAILHSFANMYGAFDVVLYFVNPTVLVANKLTSYLIVSYLILSTELFSDILITTLKTQFCFLRIYHVATNNMYYQHNWRG